MQSHAVLLALLVGCAPAPMPMNTQHPAHPDAATGRLAGPPAALRPGVADISTPPRSSSPTDHAGHGDAPQAPATNHDEPANTEPPTTEPPKTKPPKASSKAPRKTPKSTVPPKQAPPAHQGHEGHH